MKTTLDRVDPAGQRDEDKKFFKMFIICSLK